jgi:hypothetical protein
MNGKISPHTFLTLTLDKADFITQLLYPKKELKPATASSLVQELSSARTELWFFAHSSYSPIPNLTKLSQLPFFVTQNTAQSFF